MRVLDQGEWVGTVSLPTDLSSAVMLARVMAQTEAGKMPPEEVADLLFPFLFEGTIHERRAVYTSLRRLATPEAILETALRTYRIQGYEGYLNEAASLLADFKSAAWPVIRKWARGGDGACESFVDAVYNVQGVSDVERLEMLKDMVRHGDHNTRYRVLESIHLLPTPAKEDSDPNAGDRRPGRSDARRGRSAAGRGSRLSADLGNDLVSLFDGAYPLAGA